MSSKSPRRYFDNAATSFPKPTAVAAAMVRMLTEVGGPGRGGYAEAREAGRVIWTCRDRISRLVNLGKPENVVFTHNTTDALNLGIKGVLAHARSVAGPASRLHVVTTHMEHNSVLRPMNALLEVDHLIEWDRVPADPASGLVDPDDVRRAIQPGRTVLVCINHASNVTGTVQNLEAIGRVCSEFGAGTGRGEAAAGLLLLVDGAQSLGHVPVDMQAMRIDLLAFPGHKGLLGPTGTGGLCIRPGAERRLGTIREGGTGSVSEQETHPTMMPEKFEAGSHNSVGIAGLGEGVGWLLERGIDQVRAHEVRLMRLILDRLETAEFAGLRLLGPREIGRRVGVFSFVHESIEPAELSAILESAFGILSRAGLHCAPLVHGMLGTVPPTGKGATRLSLGPFLTETDVAAAMEALAEVCREHRDLVAGAVSK